MAVKAGTHPGNYEFTNTPCQCTQYTLFIFKHTLTVQYIPKCPSAYARIFADNDFYGACEGGRQFVSVCCSRLPSLQLPPQTSNATSGHIAFQMSPHHMSVCVTKRKHMRNCVRLTERERESVQWNDNERETIYMQSLSFGKVSSALQIHKAPC